jgi:hypothetical protein
VQASDDVKGSLAGPATRRFPLNLPALWAKVLRQGNFSAAGVVPGRTSVSDMSMKRYDDPKLVQSMILHLDHNYAMAEFLGAANPDGSARVRKL